MQPQEARPDKRAIKLKYTSNRKLNRGVWASTKSNSAGVQTIETGATTWPTSPVGLRKRGYCNLRISSKHFGSFCYFFLILFLSGNKNVWKELHVFAIQGCNDRIAYW